jgi:carbamoyl-phosphate synthase large subunit
MNILVTGIGGPTPLGIVKSLRMELSNIKVFGVDSNKFAPGHFDKNFDKTFIIPKAEDLDYWDVVINIIIENKIDVAFVIPETEVLIWSKRKDNFDLPCKVLLPDFEVANFMFDKLKVSNFLFTKGLSPKTFKVGNNVNLLKKQAETLGYPFWVRVNKTAGAIGALKVDNIESLLDWLKLNENGEFIASTFLPGRNYAAKILFFENQVLLSASAERVEYLMPNLSPTKITGMCARGKLINYPELIEKAESAIRGIFNYHHKKINGMFTVDFKEDNYGMPLITEINIRHVSFTHAFSLGGANFPATTIKNLIKGKCSDRVDYIFNKEYIFLRGVDYPLILVDK